MVSIHILIAELNILINLSFLSIPLESCFVRINIIVFHALYKNWNEIVVVRFLFEFNFSSVSHEFMKFFWMAFAQLIWAIFNFLFINSLISFSLCWCLTFFKKTWPWKFSKQKVHNHISNRLDIVSSTLLISLMSINANIPYSSAHTLTCDKRDVLLASWIFSISHVIFGETKITKDDLVTVLIGIPRHNIVRFDISMHKSVLMNYFYYFYHLFSYEQNCF